MQRRCAVGQASPTIARLRHRNSRSTRVGTAITCRRAKAFRFYRPYHALSLAPMELQLPLLVSALAFAALLLFRLRPAITTRARASATALDDAKRRIESAKDDDARASALADAGDASIALGRASSAEGYYLRALRTAPCSARIVTRAVTAFARRPRALEHLLWRHLAALPWEDRRRDAIVAALQGLARVYGKRRRFHVRAQALEHAIDALTGTSAKDSFS